MSLKQDLIAARALIDTPEKFAAYNGSKSHALYSATNDWESYFAADQALDKQRMRGHGFASVMAQFDRAIEVADKEPRNAE